MPASMVDRTGVVPATPTGHGYVPAVAPLTWFLLDFSAPRALSRLPGVLAPIAVAAVWIGLAALLALACRSGRGAEGRRWGAAVPAAVVAVVLALGAVAYPAVDGRRDDGGGSDQDDGVLLVADELLDGRDLYSERTYLGNEVTSGPGAVLWFVPFSSRTLYPVGLAAAVAVTFAVLRWAWGRWRPVAWTAVLLAASVPFWEAVVQGSDHVPFACSLACAGAVLSRTGAARLSTRSAVVAGAVVGALATSRSVFGFVPLLAGIGLWRRDRRLAVAFAVPGTLAVVALHAAFIARSSWSDYAPFQLVVEKSQNDVDGLGTVVLLGGIAVGAAVVVRELLRRQGSRIDVLLLAGVGGPMVGIALAGLPTAPSLATWSVGNYFADTVVLAASAFAARVTAVD